MRFIAIASVSWASFEIEPYDMAPVANRFTISLTGSTSSIGTGGRDPALNVNRPRSVARRVGLIVDELRVLLEDVVAPRTARVLQLEHRLGVEEVVLTLAAPLVLAAEVERAMGALRRVRRDRRSRAALAISSASTSSPMPPSRLTVPVKYSSTSSRPRPIASKTCAPVYDATVEMPIFDITFSTPLPAALM